ncbi:hypothetical protein QNM99_20470 [Pseudomonas sp. PCH446]
MLVRHDAPPRPKNFVAAVALENVGDGESTRDDQVIRLASELAMICDADLELLHACDIIAGYELMQEYPWDSDAAAALQKLRSQAFDDLARAHQVPGRRRHFLLGRRSSGWRSLSANVRWTPWSSAAPRPMPFPGWAALPSRCCHSPLVPC